LAAGGFSTAKARQAVRDGLDLWYTPEGHRAKAAFTLRGRGFEYVLLTSSGEPATTAP